MIAESSAAILSALPLLLCLAVVVGVPVLIVLLTRRSRRKRDADLAAQDEHLAGQWEWAKTEAARGRGHLAFVRVVYQRASTGTGAKAFINWIGTPWEQDTWFKGRPNMPQGVYVLVRGRSGWGPHNRNPKTFWVEWDGVLAIVPGDAPAAYQRHQKRTSRAA